MCGIAGYAGSSRDENALRTRFMRESLVHRGPDSAGEVVTDQVALGVRRLRVIDLVTGDQPQSNEDETVWTVFNGEIYNFRELRRELAARGHRLRTASDTEVIVHLYEELGERFVERVHGMFAIALWDARSQILVLARDRLGKKPLLYWEDGERFAFASEHEALLAGLPERPAVDPGAIRLYLRLGFVPAPMDAFHGVRKLPPAHILVWRRGRVTLRRYWSPALDIRRDLREATALEELHGLVDRAVERRLVADVPLGVFLSGGIDSSVVVATMSRFSSRVRTFTIGFEDPAYSELPYARAVATRFGTEHHEFVVQPADVAILGELVRRYGEPYADSSAVPTYFLSRLTRQHVTVALNGDGGDEAFGGYDRYLAAGVASLLDSVAPPLRQALAAVGASFPAAAGPRGLAGRMRRFLRVAALPAHERYLSWFGVFDREDVQRLLSPEFAQETEAAEVSLRERLRCLFDGRDAVVAAQETDRGLYLPDDLLVKVDIASMANSLEVRSPLLDTEIVEFAARLPPHLRVRRMETKYLLKLGYGRILPPQVLRRRKQGFGVPVGVWFRQDLRELILDVVLSERAVNRGYFRRMAVERLVRDHLEGRAEHGHRVWALLMLELWHREMVDRPTGEALRYRPPK